jgi:hypothetical protein
MCWLVFCHGWPHLLAARRSRVIRLLLALRPRAWRRTRGEEFAVLPEKTRLTHGAVLVRARPGAAIGFAGVGCRVPLDLADRD